MNKIKNMETIFKKGDTVYHHEYGKGTVTSTSGGDDNYPTEVQFDGLPHTFTYDGRYIHCQNPTLSFKEYDFVNGGFSQERPKPIFKNGDLVFFKSNGSGFWKLGFYKDGYISNSNKPKASMYPTTRVIIMQKENPFES